MCHSGIRHTLGVSDCKDWRGLQPAAKQECQSPNHADASEANLSTVSWLMKGLSRAVHQALQRQRVIVCRRSAGGARGGKLRPEPDTADGSSRTGRAHSGVWR